MSPQYSDPLRIACVGGGPGGLFAAIASAQRIPEAEIDVFERNLPTDVFGFGVVFSDATLGIIDQTDTVLRDVLAAEGTHWDRIEVRLRDERLSAGGNGMSAVHRRVLLDALRTRAQELGANLYFATAADADQLAASGKYDLIVAADGANSATRDRRVEALGHQVAHSAVKFIWFGTTYQFDGLTFLHKRSEHGNFAVHGYPIGSGLSTFIVETDEDTWRAAGLDGFDASAPPGVSDEVSQRYLTELFAPEIDGHPLVANNSRWANFRTRRTARWHAVADSGVPIVFIGDAVHTAHFSVGSGTKMAIEDAAALAEALAARPGHVREALSVFEDARHPEVAHIQNSSVPSLSWWDHFGFYYGALEPWQFGFHFFSRAISEARIGKRDRAYVASVEDSWIRRFGAPPLETPLRIGDDVLAGRLLDIVSGPDGRWRFSDGDAEIATSTRPEPGTVWLCAAPSIVATSLSDSVIREIDGAVEIGPSAVAVYGGDALMRALVSERIRLVHSIPTIIVDPVGAIRQRRAVDERDNTTTLVVSGRADAVAYEPRAMTTDVADGDAVDTRCPAAAG